MRMSVRVCVHVFAPRLLIINGAILTLYDWLNKGYSFYMAAVDVINGGRDGPHCLNGILTNIVTSHSDLGIFLMTKAN